jgi:hypothetical protein
MTKENKQTIEYNGKVYKLPFNIPSYFLTTEKVIAENHFSGEPIEVPQFVKSVRDGILYYEYNASITDKNYGDGSSEMWDKVRKGLNWFRQYFAKEYMVLLD